MSLLAQTTRTLRLRLKDKHAALLRDQAWAVNQVWNYVNELSLKHFQRQRAFLSAYDMQPYTKGAGKELGLHSQTVQSIQEEYCLRRRQHKKVRLAKTKMAKSVLDAGWSTFRTMLLYKCDDAGVWFSEVNEASSTQACSVCGSISGPKGLKDLGIREWTCQDCDTTHDRDVNAARNILERGRALLAVGITGL